MNKLVWTTGLGLVLSVGAAVAVRADDSCPTANNGACEELVQCALGTDSSDCAAICKSGAWPEESFGACAHYAALAGPATELTPGVGSGGSGGPKGVWSANITARGTGSLGKFVRHYKVYVPPSYDPREPTPLLYMLGAFTVDMYGLSAYTELMRTADLNGFIVVFPQQHYRFFNGIGWVFGWHVFKSEWRDGIWTNNPDVDFIRNLTQELEKLYNIDRTRIFASGHSRGAGMSIVLAFVLPNTIAGFISESGFIKIDGSETEGFETEIQAFAAVNSRKVPGVLVHGVKDPDVPVANSDFTAQTLRSLGWVQDRDFLFFRLERVAHEWQPQYNQLVWDFMMEHPLPVEELKP